MVRAILDGRKSQTRRIVKPQPESGIVFKDDLMKRCPYKVGMNLWVREAFAPLNTSATGAYYRADYDEINIKKAIKEGGSSGWKPSIFMPRKFSRINLEVANVRVEWVQEITELDAIAEGIGKRIGSSSMGHVFTGIEHFHALWDSINKKRGYGWAENPWVWVVEFKEEL